jgi:hypothetical protein
MISTLSGYTVGPGGNISSETLATLKEIVAGELVRLNPGFTGNDLTRLEAYLVLNAFEGEDTGIKQERIKDHSWIFKDGIPGTRWMFAAQQFIASYKSEDLVEFSGIERCDSEMVSMASDRIRPEVFGEIETGYKRTRWDQDYN